MKASAELCSAQSEARAIVIWAKAVDDSDRKVIDLMQLPFCGHHSNRHHAALRADGWTIVHDERDESEQLINDPEAKAPQAQAQRA